MVATYLGVVDEEQINNMSYVFFEDILTELGYRLTYDAIVNYAGNSFCEKSWDMILENNPFNINEKGGTNNRALSALADFFGSADVQIKQGGNSKGVKAHGKGKG